MGNLELPLILLAGRDRRGSELPEEGRDLHVLRGYKAIELEIAGQPLLVRLIERLRDCGAFAPIFLAGPARVYGPLVAEELAGEVLVVDTDGDFGENIRAGLEAAMAHGHHGQVAVMTSDVLPDPADLREALDDLRQHQPCDFWCVECRVRDAAQLGASAWKPEYLIQPEGESRPVPTLPGHLVVADMAAARLDLLYRIFELAYRTRNRPMAYRQAMIVSGALLALLGKDLERILSLRWPTLTWEMVWHGVALGRKLVTSGVPQREMEYLLRRMWVRTSHRRRHPERRGRVFIMDGLSLARDIDTLEEAREMSRQLEQATV